MLPFYPFYWADYGSKTLYLTMQQHGAYLLLLRFQYTTGRRIPHELRYSLATGSLEQERADVDFVLGQFFKRKGDEWYSEKAEAVIKEATDRHQAFVNGGKNSRKAPYSQPSQRLPASSKPASSNYNNNNKERSGASRRGSEGRADAAPLETKTIHPSWNGSRAKLTGMLDKGDAEFVAYYAETELEVGPPMVLCVPTEARRGMIVRNHGSKLSRLFGLIEIQVAKDVNA